MRLMVRVVSQKERGALVGGVFMICQQTAELALHMKCSGASEEHSRPWQF